MNADQLAKIAHALSDPTRLSIFEKIASRKEMNCSEILSAHDLSPGTVSHHLKILAEAALVESRRRGQFIYNRSVPLTLKAYAKELKRMAEPADSKKHRK